MLRRQRPGREHVRTVVGEPRWISATNWSRQDDVLNGISSCSDDALVQRIETLAASQPDLCAFILSSPLPPSASFPGALSAFAIIWMFEQYYLPRALPNIGVASIQRCVDRTARSFLDFNNPHNTMSGRNQSHIHLGLEFVEAARRW